MTVQFHAIYDRVSRTLRPLEKVDLPDGELVVTVRSATGLPVPSGQETEHSQSLADVLGFSPDDEQKLAELAESQYQAIEAMHAQILADGLEPLLERLPPSDADLDRILYADHDS